MLTKLRNMVQEFFAFEAEILYKAGFTPNRMTILGFFLAILSSYAYMSWRFNHPFMLFLAAVSLLISGFCDLIDGIMARNYGRATAFGGFIDSLLDRYSDVIVLAGILLGELCEPLWGILAIVGSLLVSYARARAEAVGIKMESIGLAERAERIVILVISTLIAIFNPEALKWATILLALITNFTVLQRTLYFYRMRG